MPRIYLQMRNQLRTEPQPTEYDKGMRESLKYLNSRKKPDLESTMTKSGSGSLTKIVACGSIPPLRSLKFRSQFGVAEYVEVLKSNELSNLAMQVFDVFLIHNSDDKPMVRLLADRLISRNLKPWLDERELVPGRPWQNALEATMKSVRCRWMIKGCRLLASERDKWFAPESPGAAPRLRVGLW